MFRGATRLRLATLRGGLRLAGAAGAAALGTSALATVGVCALQPADSSLPAETLAESLIDWTCLEYADAIKAMRKAYDLPVAAMESLRAHFLADARAGLAGNESSMRMLPSYVNQRITGNETGDFYALDLGGTNFRVLRLTLEGGGKVGPLTQGKFEVPEDIKKGDAEALFGFLADAIATFLATRCGGNPTGKLGFTFSFPIEQTSLNSGTLVVWNKDFAASGVIGEDVVALLQKQLRSRGISLEVRALVNDTVGTMEAAAYRHPNTALGVILGTGTNAAYIEKAEKVGKWRGPPADEMVINTEWGNLNMEGLMNGFDVAVDRATGDNAGNQQFEKMLSGMYLGELCRRTIVDPAVCSAFSRPFAEAVKASYSERMSLPTSLMSSIEADGTAELTAAAAALEAAGVRHSTYRDRALLREACICISTRAARLAAVGIVSLLEQIESEGRCTVAVDGTVFECYPHFKERLEHGIAMMVGQQRAREIELVLAKDGSGVGAAIIAAIEQR